MKKLFFLFLLIFVGQICLKAQKTSEKTLYIVDSIPILTDPEYWDNINDSDIADMCVIKDKDSLKMLGWPRFQGITYIFTKDYRSRPDSIKRIPSFKQMKLKDSVWTFNNLPYTGKYIDYYLNGTKQTEGEMLEGKINGKVKMFFQNGNLKSVVECKNGTYDGEKTDYYRNGQLFEKSLYSQGRQTKLDTMDYLKMYYLNGQKYYERIKGKNSSLDTLVNYYSTGKVKKRSLLKSDGVKRTNKENSINYYALMFNQALNQHYLKQADKNLKMILKLKIKYDDPNDDDTYVMQGLLSENNAKYEEAAFYYDSALKLEPMNIAALIRWSLCTIRKYSGKEKEITVEDLKNVPLDEQIKICKYFKLAEDIDPRGIYGKRFVPINILNYCSGQPEFNQSQILFPRSQFR